MQQYRRGPEGSSDSATRDSFNPSNSDLVVEAVNFIVRHKKKKKKLKIYEYIIKTLVGASLVAQW